MPDVLSVSPPASSAHVVMGSPSDMWDSVILEVPDWKHRCARRQWKGRPEKVEVGNRGIGSPSS